MPRSQHGTMASDHQHHHQVSNRAVNWQMRAAAHAKIADQRIRHVCSALLCRMGGSLRAFALASFERNERVSGDHLPPTSPARTRRVLLRGPTNSGLVLSQRVLAASNVTPSVCAAPLRGDPSQCNVDTSVVSMANCTPPNRGSPSATTSTRRPSVMGTPKSMSRIILFVVTRAPPSRQIRAAADSTAKPRPETAHATRWFGVRHHWEHLSCPVPSFTPPGSWSSHS